jgi:hypothetical protein
MRVGNLFSIFSSLVLTGALVVCAAENARAQEEAAAESVSPAPRPAEKFDEYGRLGHCDLTARLDNLAVTLQNDPRAKAFVVVYNPLEKKNNYAGRNLKFARFYLVNVRGIESGRVVTVDGGGKDIKEGVTELWVVPEGAEPPAEPPAADKYAARDFSGKFDSHMTDAQIYKEVVEMGHTASEIAYAEFSEKLKQQPESVGYLVVRAPKAGLPGDWRRVGRRDEQILARDYGVEAARLTSINGGRSEGEDAEVEFWILPKNAPPPAAAPEEPARKLDAPLRLNRFDSYGSLDRNAERWMLESLAEALRENPRASAFLIARGEAEVEVEGGAEEETAEESEEEADGEEETAEAEEAEDPAAEGEESDGEIEGSAIDFAGWWKDILVNKYGIEAHRVVVSEGRPMPWSVSRLTTWLVPEDAPRPDPFARDEDDPEEEVIQESAGGDNAEAKETAAPPPLN